MLCKEGFIKLTVLRASMTRRKEVERILFSAVIMELAFLGIWRSGRGMSGGGMYLFPQ